MSQTSHLGPFVNRLTERSILTEGEKDLILGLPFRVHQPHPNQDIVELGQKADHACYVVEGLVGRFDQNSSGDRQITALHIPGDMPDLHSLMHPTATSGLQALTNCTLLEIPHAALTSLTIEYPAIAEAFWRDCMVDSTILAQWVVNIGRRKATSRIAHLFCEMACRYKIVRVGNEVRFELPMTQGHLADATGLTPVHVNRMLKRIAQIGTTFHHQIVRIDDWDALVALGDFRRHYLQADLRPEDRMRITG